MLTLRDVFIQVSKLTSELIATGFCVDQNFPSIEQRTGEIKVTSVDNSIFLKSIPYSEMYYEALKRRAFNVKLIDGALIYMLYQFKNGELMKHRLAYFPAPDLELFQNEPELYMEDELYADILDKQIVTVPIRFDFDKSEGVYKPIEHPVSHLTLGQYKNCRIPVTTALTPYQFISFIMRNFYHTAQISCEEKLTVFKDCFEKSIFEEEYTVLHICTPGNR
ncbi:MAG: DUF2290 domain-containing protein [Clostridiales bacterium]|nr:DUF2290 domain-containing protein [Clostridiales bacterium]